MIAGNTYKFKVEAHNAIGYGTASTTFAIIAATIPDVPQPPLSTFNGESVTLSWIVPFNGGQAVNGYTITIRQVDDITFTE